MKQFALAPRSVSMMPTVIVLKLNRSVIRAGVTLAQIAGAFAAQLSTRANPTPQPRRATTGKTVLRGVRSAPQPAKRPGISRKNVRVRTRAA